jgi:hypothetical protein
LDSKVGREGWVMSDEVLDLLSPEACRAVRREALNLELSIDEFLALLVAKMKEIKERNRKRKYK